MDQPRGLQNRQARIACRGKCAGSIAVAMGLSVSSGILGWVLDAFTFFILIFVVDALAENFHVDKAAIVWSITITLATRPIGALILGSMADQIRPPPSTHRLRALLFHLHRAYSFRAKLYGLSFSFALFMASAWAATGASAPHS